MKATVYDAGVLIAADHNERRAWAEHRVLLEASVIPSVPSPVVAQVSRSAAQVQLARFLRGCEVVAFTQADAHQAGQLLGKSRSRDVVSAADVSVAISAPMPSATTNSATSTSMSVNARWRGRLITSASGPAQ